MFETPITQVVKMSKESQQPSRQPKIEVINQNRAAKALNLLESELSNETPSITKKKRMQKE